MEVVVITVSAGKAVIMHLVVETGIRSIAVAAAETGKPADLNCRIERLIQKKYRERYRKHRQNLRVLPAEVKALKQNIAGRKEIKWQKMPMPVKQMYCRLQNL